VLLLKHLLSTRGPAFVVDNLHASLMRAQRQADRPARIEASRQGGDSRKASGRESRSLLFPIAIGPKAVGTIAIEGIAVGLFACGIVGVGLVSFSTIGIALLGERTTLSGQ